MAACQYCLYSKYEFVHAKSILEGNELQLSHFGGLPCFGGCAFWKPLLLILLWLKGNRSALQQWELNLPSLDAPQGLGLQAAMQHLKHSRAIHTNLQLADCSIVFVLPEEIR